MEFDSKGLRGQKLIARRNLRARLANAKKVQHEFDIEFRNRMVTFVSTAFGVVAALFWQTAITDSIKSVIAVNGAWPYEILVALMVTLLPMVVGP